MVCGESVHQKNQFWQHGIMPCAELGNGNLPFQLSVWRIQNEKAVISPFAFRIALHEKGMHGSSVFTVFGLFVLREIHAFFVNIQVALKADDIPFLPVINKQKIASSVIGVEMVIRIRNHGNIKSVENPVVVVMYLVSSFSA